MVPQGLYLNLHSCTFAQHFSLYRNKLLVPRGNQVLRHLWKTPSTLPLWRLHTLGNVLLTIIMHILVSLLNRIMIGFYHNYAVQSLLASHALFPVFMLHAEKIRELGIRLVHFIVIFSLFHSCCCPDHPPWNSGVGTKQLHTHV